MITPGDIVVGWGVVVITIIIYSLLLAAKRYDDAERRREYTQCHQCGEPYHPDESDAPPPHQMLFCSRHCWTEFLARDEHQEVVEK